MNQLLFCLQLLLIGGVFRLALRRGESALVCAVVGMGVLANLFVLKQIAYWGWSATASDAFAVGGVLGLNLLQEVFGRAAAQRAVAVGFGALLFVAVMAQVHLLFEPAVSDGAQAAYEQLFSPAPRLWAASFVSFWVVQQLDVHLFGALRGSFGVKAAISGFLSQAVDTALFTVLGLWGLMEGLGEVFLVSLLVKWAAVMLGAPMVGWVRRAV